MLGSQETRVSDVRHDLAAVRNDLARLANTVSGLVTSQTRSVRGSMRDTVGQARGQAYDQASELGKMGAAFADEARDRLRHANAEVETRIERNPITAVLIAAGIGLVLGLMSRSR